MRAARLRTLQSISRRHNSSRAPIPADSPIFKISSEVRDALISRAKPVVALESTIYTHGFAHPKNLALANELESIIRQNGGIPATIAVLNGVAHVGLSGSQLSQLLTAQNVNKVSRRDFAFNLSSSGHFGGTTISGTMILAQKAGIKVFATGGLGGVHRGGEKSMDVSADLTELGRTAVAVVASGCKGFLDIARTLEYLETQGVPVATLLDGRRAGSRIDFPAFWVRNSGVNSPFVVEGPKAAARMIHSQSQLGLETGILFANPIPEESEIPKDVIDNIIESAIIESEKAGATGKDNTPYILSKIRDLTRGESVVANEALVENNVRTGTLIAKELLELEAGSSNSIANNDSQHFINSSSVYEKRVNSVIQENQSRHGIFIAGALAVDYACDLHLSKSDPSTAPILHTSNPAAISQSLGGVGYNVARAAKLLKANVQFCSIVGDDLAGALALQHLQSQGLDTSGIEKDTSLESRTSQYIAVNDSNRDLHLAMADMGIMERDTDRLREKWKLALETAAPDWVVLDANWSAQVMQYWLGAAKQVGAKTAVEPVSVAKSERLFPRTPGMKVYPDHNLDLASPNKDELFSLYTAAEENDYFNGAHFEVVDSFGIPGSGGHERILRATSEELVQEGIPQRALKLLPYIPCIVTTLGPRGVLLAMLLENDDWRLKDSALQKYVVARGSRSVYMRQFKPQKTLQADDIVNVNGAGDTFLGALVAELGSPSCKSIEDAIELAQSAAVMTLTSTESVSPELTTLKD